MITVLSRARRLIFGAAVLALAVGAGASLAADTRFDLPSLRAAVAADDAAGIRRLLAAERQASGSELRSAATAALGDEAAALAAARQVILLLAEIQATQSDPAIRSDLLQRIDRQVASERKLDAAIAAVAMPVRIDKLDALASPVRVGVSYSGAIDGDTLTGRWQLLDASQDPPRLIDLGRREVKLKPGAGKIELAQPEATPANAGPWRVTITGRGASTALMVDPPSPAKAPAPATAPKAAVAAVPPPPPSTAAEPELRWATQAINLRAEARANAARVGQLKAGESVRVLSTTTDGWAWVEVAGKQGYAALAYLSPTKPAPKAATPAPASVPPPAPKPIEGAASVLDTANLVVAGQSVALFGISGLDGAPAEQLGRFIKEQGGRLRCAPREGAWECATASGIDVAKAALVNGAARTKPGAPADYLRQEEAARNARRGLWGNS